MVLRKREKSPRKRRNLKEKMRKIQLIFLKVSSMNL